MRKEDHDSGTGLCCVNGRALWTESNAEKRSKVQRSSVESTEELEN